MPLSPECCWNYRHIPPRLLPSPYKDKQDCFKNSLISIPQIWRASGCWTWTSGSTDCEGRRLETVFSPSRSLRGNLFDEERLSVVLQQAPTQKGRLIKRTEDRLTSSNARKTPWVISTVTVHSLTLCLRAYLIRFPKLMYEKEINKKKTILKISQKKNTLLCTLL